MIIVLISITFLITGYNLETSQAFNNFEVVNSNLE